MFQEHNRTIWWALGLSLFIHLFMALSGQQLVLFLPELKQKLQKNIELTTIDPSELKKYKTVGIENGDEKDHFSLPSTREHTQIMAKPSTTLESLGVSNQELKEQEKLQEIKQNKLQKTISSKDLINSKFGQIENDIPLNSANNIGKPDKNEIGLERIRILQEASRNAGLTSEDKQILSATGLDVNFSPPKGVSEDKLNSDEKVFYAFQKRTYTSYITSFISQYRKMLLLRPSLKEELLSGRHRLSGKIVFDVDGNILTLKILSGSPNDDIQKLFESTLENIHKLPNPPKALVKDGQFTIYYQLQINS